MSNFTILLTDVSKSFTQGSTIITALDHVDLAVHEGQIFGVIGHSGAGKSTLIRLLNGLERVDSGRVLVHGLDLTTSSEARLRAARLKIGMIFQHFNLLWSRTVAQNIAFPLEIAGADRRQIRQRVGELIALVGLEGREDAYPAQLSGGQKQRVGIARALANQPDILLCDEATSALDPETTDAILDLLADINKRLGPTIVLITHEMHVVHRICDAVAVMEAGRIVETGSVRDIFTRPQAAVTQRFIRQAAPRSDDDIFDPEVFEPKAGAIVKLVYVGEQARNSVIADAIRHFDLPINIVHGRVTHTREAAIGELYVQVPVDATRLGQLREFFETRDVRTEIVREGAAS